MTPPRAVCEKPDTYTFIDRARQFRGRGENPEFPHELRSSIIGFKRSRVENLCAERESLGDAARWGGSRGGTDRK